MAQDTCAIPTLGFGICDNICRTALFGFYVGEAVASAADSSIMTKIREDRDMVQGLIVVNTGGVPGISDGGLNIDVWDTDNNKSQDSSITVEEWTRIDNRLRKTHHDRGAPKEEALESTPIKKNIT